MSQRLITLTTLKDATPQQVFDQVAHHLLTQRDKAWDPDRGCAYRDGAGLRCAAGCLIGDDEYDPAFEDNRWLTLVDEGRVPLHHTVLIARLQDVHDKGPIEAWVDELTAVADDFGLSDAVITQGGLR